MTDIPPYEAESIANYFLNRAEKEGVSDISPLKLQKLVYYAHGWSLGLNDEPLINENIEAWQYGPVISSLYHRFKSFGNNKIDIKACKLSRDKKSLVEYEIPTHQNTLLLLDSVWRNYKEFSAIALSNMTHEDGTPWSKTSREFRNSHIDNDVIKQYFKERAAAVLELAE